MKNDKLWIKEMLVIGVVSLALALLYNIFSPNSLELFPEEKPTVNDDELFSSSPEPYNEIFEEAFTDSLAETKKITEKKQTTPDTQNRAVSTSTQKEVEEKQTTKPTTDVATSKATNKTTETFNGFKAISRAQLEKAIGDNRFIIIDARTEHDYEEDHVKGAINIYPMADDESVMMEKILTLPRGKRYLLYCNGPLCDLAEELGHIMQEFDFEDIYIYPGGWEGWTEERGNK